MTQCMCHLVCVCVCVCVCFCVVPLLYKVEFCFRDFVALPHWAISGVVYVNTIVRVGVRRGVFFLCV